MQRPAEIVWFERIMIAIIILGELSLWVLWPQTVAYHRPAIVLTLNFLNLVILLVLVFLVSRRRSNIAMWVLVAWFLVGLPSFVEELFAGELGGAILWIRAIGQIVALALLFRPASNRWFNENRLRDKTAASLFHPLLP